MQHHVQHHAVTPAETRNVAWAGLEAAVSGGLSLVSAFVIARLIGPGEFGIAAAAVALHVMLWVAANALFADALVQRATLDDRAASSAFWAALGAGCLGAVVQAAGGVVLAMGLGDTRIVPMSLMLAVPLPLVGIAGVAQGLLTRRRAYRMLAGRAIVGQGLGTAAGITAALCRAGAWAPVVQQAVSSVAGAATLLAGAGWRPCLVWDTAALRALLRVALPLTASTLVLSARYRLFAVLLGGTAGATPLGETHMAFRLVDTVRELCATAQWRLMLPVLSERQGDAAALRSAVDRLTRLSNKLLLPLCGVMALALPFLAAHLLGPAWQEAGQAAEPLIGLMALLCLMFPAGVATVARGQADRTLLGNLGCLAFALSGVLWLRPVTAFQAVLIWCGAHLLCTPYALWVNGRALETRPLRPLRAGVAVSAVAVTAVAAALAVPDDGSLLRLCCRLAVLAAVTLAGSLIA